MIVVDPDRYAFTLPLLNFSVAWYGILFALGFLISFFICRSYFFIRLTHFNEGGKKEALALVDKLVFYVVIGSIVGARLFEVFFYAWPYYKEHPLDIIKVWQGGLASHGGAFGVIVGILLYVYFNRSSCKKTITLLSVLDATTIGGAFTGCLIRIGNFINQEIVGIPTDVPWAVTFLHPSDYLLPVPRHPVQLYESFFYLITFIVLFIVYKKKRAIFQEGKISGLFFMMVFTFRFFIEYFKVEPSELIIIDTISMGQLLSIPFILFGIYLYFRRKKQLN
jgi:phosphatidylglycerol:prolipoprotein diacylglycerol transferase